jgi:ribonuclease J
MAKYTSAAEEIGLVNFSKHAEISGYKSQVKKTLAKIQNDGSHKYLIIATGHQGEPDAVLSRIVDGKLKFELRPEDHVIFSCSVIPSPQNIANRETVEQKLKSKKIRIFKDIHVSGHASREDHRDLITMLKPKNIIPAHGDISKTSGLADLAEEMGYNVGNNIFLMHDGQRISFD